MAEGSMKGRGPRGGHGGPGLVEKPKDFKGSVGKLFRFMGRYAWGLVFVIILSVGSTVFNIIGPKKMGDATDEIYKGLTNGKGMDFDAIKQILLVLITLYAISAILAWIQGIVMTGISNKVAYRLREDISTKINRMPMKYFESRTYGEVLSRVTNDVDTLTMGLNQSLTQFFSSLAMIIGVFYMMITMNVPLTLMAVLILPVCMFGIAFIMKRSQKYFRQQQEYLGKINGQVEEIYGGHNIVKAFNKEEETLEEFMQTNDVLYESAWKSQFMSGMMMPIMQFVGNLGYALVAFLGGYLVIKNKISVGNIQSFIQYIRQFTQPIQQLAQILNQFQSMTAASERVFEFLEEEEEVEITQTFDSSKLNGHVEFEHIKFGYNEDQTIIHDFSTSVKDGQTVAIVGPTGAGKTTMIKLLMRFYDVDAGSIFVDGHDLKEFERAKLRELFGMVLQDTWLFNGTIKDNIRYGKLDATDEEIVAAAKAAHAHHFIKTQAHGYDTMLDEETSNISQGQKQLLTIARAILADPQILILDEATSSVDTRTEIRIQKAMNNLMKGRTSFVIAHRLSTIKDADLILVMKDGDIVEQGNHKELLAKDGFYASLYNAQFDAGTAAS